MEAVLPSRPGVADGPDIDSELAEIAGVLNAQHSRLVALVERALDTDRWRAADIHSPAQWLAWKAGLSPHRANEIVRCAERRSEFPRVSAVFDRGELAVDQVIAVMNAPAWADEHLAEFATVTTVSQLRKTMTATVLRRRPRISTGRTGRRGTRPVGDVRRRVRPLANRRLG